jgi:crotonobetainyl-CoA:carnitine CoA-transferase CaiB-like acyl-CoA transferase
MLLGDMGATVVKVESRTGGDETRSWSPPLRDGKSTYFLSINRNKHSIALDFNNADDLATAQSIAARADVVVENFMPGRLAKFGLDYVSVAATNPQVVYASISGFGVKAGAHLPGYDLLVQALSGMMTLTGDVHTPPYRSGVAIFDVVTGLHTCIGILAALSNRSTTGLGQQVQLDLMSSALSGMVNQTGAQVLTGVVPRRMGNEHPSIYPYAPFPTADGQLVITVGNDRQFHSLCRGLGIADVADDVRFAETEARNRNRVDLQPLLEAALARQTAIEWADVLTRAGVPCAPILDVQQGIAYAERLGLDPVVRAGSGDDSMPGIRNPIRFSLTPVSYDLAPPELNNAGERVRRWLERTPSAVDAHSGSRIRETA